ncbi:MAG: hypothetical protein IPK64_14275 [bacterium]|nr:hypothetical protein [bacterium]
MGGSYGNRGRTGEACRAVAALALVGCWAALAGAAAPQVTNVALSQRTDGSRVLDIFYDLADTDGDTARISLHLSADDGATWGFPVLNASGDIGAGVTPGTGRVIHLDYGSVPDPIEVQQMRARVIASDRGVSFAPHSPRNVAVLQLNPSDWRDPAHLERVAQADLLVVTADEMWAGSDLAAEPVIANLKAINPDLKVVGYVSAFTSRLSGANSPPGSFWHQWYQRLRPYWVYTTVGDTSMTWPGAVVINTLDPACRQVMVETIVEFQRNSLNQMDGVYWDYFNSALWVYPELTIQGDPDMDGDGVAHAQDPDELAAFRASQISLVTALRDSLGEGFLQIFNGQRAYGDQAFASLADGLMYELYPTLFFPQPNARNSLDPAYAYNLNVVRGWLRTGNGGPWILLSNTWRNQFVDQNGQLTLLQTGNQFRVVAMLMDGYAAWNSHDGSTFSYTYGWTDNDICVGEPVGPPVHDGDFIRRDFQYGRVELEWKTGRYPDPFNYRVWSLGQLVEELSVPYRFP